jgi:hypothetical protein
LRVLFVLPADHSVIRRRRVSTVQLWTEAKLLEAARAFQPACVVLAAADLDIFTVLARGAATAAALASVLDTDPRATAILLDALAALNLLANRAMLRGPPRAANLLR